MQLRSAAKVLIRRRSDGKYLILNTSQWDENPNRSQQPDLPGGLAEADETITEALRREIKEEIGVDLLEKMLKLVFGTAYIEKTLQQSTTFLIYFIEVQDINVKLSWEHESYEWMTADEVAGLTIRQPYPTIFKHLAEIGVLID